MIKINRETLAKIDSIINPYQMDDLKKLAQEHLNSYLNFEDRKEFVQLSRKINKSITYTQNTYTLWRVIVGSMDSLTIGGNEFNLKKLSEGLISSANSRYQSWSLRKSSPFIFKDRLEAICDGYFDSSIMIMIEKTFPTRSIVTHFPTLIRILKHCGYDSIYTDFFHDSGWHEEKEVIVSAPKIIKFDKLWFVTKEKKSKFHITQYKKTSGTPLIPLVNGKLVNTNTLYF